MNIEQQLFRMSEDDIFWWEDACDEMKLTSSRTFRTSQMMTRSSQEKRASTNQKASSDAKIAKRDDIKSW